MTIGPAIESKIVRACVCACWGGGGAGDQEKKMGERRGTDGTPYPKLIKLPSVLPLIAN